MDEEKGQRRLLGLQLITMTTPVALYPRRTLLRIYPDPVSGWHATFSFVFRVWWTHLSSCDWRPHAVY